MTNFHPFFLECAKQEVDNDRKKQLENLAFGNALAITKANKNVLLTDTDEFIIPDDFSLTSWNELKNKLWKDQNTEYYKMENRIKDRFSSWNAMKKRDKVRRLDNLIITTFETGDRRYMKIILIMLFLLKIVNVSDIGSDVQLEV